MPALLSSCAPGQCLISYRYACEARRETGGCHWCIRFTEERGPCIAWQTCYNKAMADFAPTAQQQEIIEASQTGGNMVIEAGAGTGKTSTLKLIALANPTKKILYVAYNKAIQTDAAASFPSNVECRTAHSLAYAKVGKLFRTRLNGQRVPAREAIKFLGIPAQGFTSGEVTLSPYVVNGMVTRTIANFCNSADAEVGERHVPFQEGAEEAMDELRTFVAGFARKAWKNVSDPKARGLRVTHDVYLKLWALALPQLGYDIVMLDEAQDANPCIAQVVEAQNAQKIMVGDRCQAIYGWRGAIDAMTSFAADHRLVLSQSFRFGPAVAEQANIFLGLLDAPLRLEGFDKIASTVETLDDPDAILCRTNAMVVEQAMAAQSQGKRAAIVGGTKEIEAFAQAAMDLQSGRFTNHNELAAFKTWREVVEYASSDEGSDLRVMVRLIDNYGPETVMEVAQNSVDEESADLIVSTAHKAKGREWNRVRIASDFKAPEDGTPSRPELMLLYVAVTRAQQILDNEAIAWVDALALA